MKHYGICPGSCGEFIQGMIKDKEYLVSYAVNMYSRADIYEKSNNVNRGHFKSRRALEKVFEHFGFSKNDTKNISLRIKSNIPLGKGMASSTADIGATIKATLSFLNKDMTDEEISKIAATIEPTDSIYINDNCIFDPLKGEIFKKLGYIDGIKILTLEPDERLNTQHIRKRQDYFIKKKANEEKLKYAFDILEKGFENKDLSLVGKAATISSILNENIHKKEGLSEIIKISEDYGAYGVNVAHSGTVVGIILDKDMDEAKLKEKLIMNKIDKKYKKIYSLNVIRAGLKGGSYEVHKKSK
ncbi:cobalamin biosynthesis protein [Tepidibacter hydrothermalis]|uniref:Cobalamin biosynthesis protein n=1 Tax=Tepidibacter hydrothermalis TaxID=3036126 RepID=A0ABY8EAE7_9FIRM|nr:cobalamin biosynthesis protein [Tepidibacter hydrothermalis]WFD09908.1 cobalamin biosynthesis protein [Tepidibacter hydrothermalis]